MKRIATTLTTMAALGLVTPVLQAEETNMDQLAKRLSKIETRLSNLETSVAAVGSHSYNKDATLEATQGAENQNQKTETDTYVIQDGDTLGAIARKHGVERADLLAANRLSEGQPIYIGETLIIPSAELEAPVNEVKQEPKKETKIAENTTKPADATKKSVVVGETKEPAPTAPSFYTVAKGDTLTSIARKNGTDVAALKEVNGLKSDTISLGQKLKLPTATELAKTETKPKTNQQNARYEYDNPLLKSSETYGYYTVRKGDNLYALARDFFSTMGELQRLNRLGSSTLIHPGDELIVPTSKYNAYHSNGEVASR